MKVLIQRTPEEYTGLPLCPRCGDDGTGHSYYICADKKGYSHDESCALYTFGPTCPQCDQEMADEG